MKTDENWFCYLKVWAGKGLPCVFVCFLRVLLFSLSVCVVCGVPFQTIIKACWLNRYFGCCLFGDGCFSMIFDVSSLGRLLLLRSHEIFPMKFVVDLNVSWAERNDITHRSNLTSSASVVFRIYSKFRHTDQIRRNRPFLIQIIPFSFFALIWNSLLNYFAGQIQKRRVPELPADHPTPSTVSVS